MILSGEKGVSRVQALLEVPPGVRFGLLVMVYAVLIGLALAYPRVARHFASQAHKAPALPTVAALNGQSLSYLGFFTALRATHGREVLNHCMESMAILQAADKAGITLSSEEVSPEVTQIDQRFHDPSVRSYFEQDARAHLLLRKLLLRNVTEAQRHHIYETFKPALRQFDISVIAATTSSAAQKIEAALRHHGIFGELAGYYSQDDRTRRNAGRIGFVSWTWLVTQFGPAQADMVTHLEPGTFARLQTENTIVFVQLHAVRDDYKDLKASVEDVLVNAARVKFLYGLMQGAKVTYPDLDLATPPEEPVPQLSGNPEVTHTAAALPGNKTVEHLAAPLPGNKTVERVAVPLPGNTNAPAR